MDSISHPMKITKNVTVQPFLQLQPVLFLCPFGCCSSALCHFCLFWQFRSGIAQLLSGGSYHNMKSSILVVPGASGLVVMSIEAIKLNKSQLF
jgi:hypothetical protein